MGGGFSHVLSSKIIPPLQTVGSQEMKNAGRLGKSTRNDNFALQVLSKTITNVSSVHAKLDAVATVVQVSLGPSLLETSHFFTAVLQLVRRGGGQVRVIPSGQQILD